MLFADQELPIMKLKKFLITAIFMVMVMPVFSLRAYAYTIQVNSTKIDTSVIIPVIIVIAVIIIAFKGKSGKTDNDNFGNNTNGWFTKTHDYKDEYGLNNEERQMLRLYEMETERKKPNPVSTHCPNCGAPVTIRDRAVCPYCQSDIINNSVEYQESHKRKPIPPTEYNPTRYYDENLTGYERNHRSNNNNYMSNNDRYDEYGNPPYSDYPDDYNNNR